MKNEISTINYHLPEIKANNRYAQSVKGNHKEKIIKKLSDKNAIKYQRKGDIIWSRNINHINFNKRKNSSINEENNINSNKLSSIFYKANNNKSGYNLTISFPFKDNNKIQDSNKTNIIFNNKSIKFSSVKNVNNNLIKKINSHIFESIADISNSNGSNNMDDKKYKLKYKNINFFSDYSTPNQIKQKNKIELSTINIKKNNNIFNKLSQDSNITNSNFIKLKINKEDLINNKIYINNNIDSTQNSIIKNNDNKELESEKAYGKNKKYYIAQNSKKPRKNIANINNIKYKLIVPGMMNSSSSNFKKKIFKCLEDEKMPNKSNINNENISFLKNLKYHENLNNVNNFILILKNHINIEYEFINIIEKVNIQNNYKENDIMVKRLINKYNIFFNHLNDISFEINIFVQNEYNNLLQKIVKILICFQCLIFIILTLYDTNLCFNIIIIHYMDIFKKISFCLYNIFFKFIYIDLKSNRYNDLFFIDLINNLYENNSKYKIKSTLSIIDVFLLLKNNCDIIIDALNKKLNFNNFMSDILLSLKTALMIINQKDLLFFIDICLNNFLYTILDKNIQKAKNNSNIQKKRIALNSVPYLPPILGESKYKYTVVLDMDETLGHFIFNEIKNKYFSNYGYLISDDKNNFNKISDNKDKLRVGLFLVRPYAKYFLEELNKLDYEIVIFTAGTKEYCDKVLDIIDLNNELIKYRLYRTHMSLRNINKDVKDLSLLGRDLNKIIIIDNFPDNYKLQKDNGLPINSWTGDINDTSLKDILNIMKYLVDKKVRDVREIIRKIKEKLNYDNIDYKKMNLIK